MLPAGSSNKNAKVELDGKDVPVTASVANGRISLAFASTLALTEGQKLNVTIN